MSGQHAHSERSADFWAWRHAAACQRADASLFFAADGERGAARERRERRAKAVCASCPVIEPCASYALSHRELYGVWGGLTEQERDVLWRQQPRPVPLATVAAVPSAQAG